MNTKSMYFIFSILIFTSCSYFSVKNKVVTDYFLEDSDKIFAIYEATNNSDELRNGFYIEFMENGDTSANLYYSNGLMEGEQVYFYENGNVSKQINYKQHKKDGVYNSFHQNGSPKFSVKYLEGKLVAIFFVKDTLGNILDHGSFQKGNGRVNSYDSDGHVIGIGEYLNGIPCCTWKFIHITSGDTIITKVEDASIHSGFNNFY